jgi:hypothetical protein
MLKGFKPGWTGIAMPTPPGFLFSGKIAPMGCLYSQDRKKGPDTALTIRGVLP